MQKKYFLFALAGVILICGCNKQAKINSQKIDLLSQRIMEMQILQGKQMELVEGQLKLLAPELNQMNSSYYEKNRDNELFLHTNTLYLLLTVGKQIESQLKAADVARDSQNLQLFNYHTNEIAALAYCTAQIEDSITLQESNVEMNVIAETKRMNAMLGDELQEKIQIATTPNADELARRKNLEDQIAQLQRDLALVKTKIGITNQ